MNQYEKKVNKIVTDIARQRIGIETLETQNLDRLDFHDVRVSSLKDALKAAFEAGRDYEAGE